MEIFYFGINVSYISHHVCLDVLLFELEFILII